jgi:hypothetical protein
MSDPINLMICLNLNMAYRSKGMSKKAEEHFGMVNRRRGSGRGDAR